MGKKVIIPQMFDVRPVDRMGNLDWERIKRVEHSALNAASDDFARSGTRDKKSNDWKYARQRSHLFQKKQSSLHELSKKDDEPLYQEELFFSTLDQNHNHPEQNFYQEGAEMSVNDYDSTYEKLSDDEEYISEENEWRIMPLFQRVEIILRHLWNKIARVSIKKLYWIPLSAVFLVVIAYFAVNGRVIKRDVLGESEEGYRYLESAIRSVQEGDFAVSSLNFQKAYDNFEDATRKLELVGLDIADLARFLPVASVISSGKNAIEAGKNLSLAGHEISEVVFLFKKLSESPKVGSMDISFLQLFKDIESHLQKALVALEAASQNFEMINLEDLPNDKRDKFLEAKNSLPPIISLARGFLNNSDIIVDLLGGHGPRKYLFLFQNNYEMRATGGFIGSYGLLDINNGRIRSFFIDGIFNPDGQLKEKIVPPEPIQKISAAWSMHDSNWWPNFPTSAQKAILFYEKTGGPTADGIIAITPNVIKKMLEVTGPIEMPKYKTTITAENFVEEIQKEVEIDKDMGEKDPKKILHDMTPIILDRLFNLRNGQSMYQIIQILSEGLNEKHILLYSQNKNLQELISRQNWSGEIYETNKDYISVINSNINGYKTDGVIEESIDHKTEIKEDGSVIDSVTVTRRHKGGDTPYEWFNKVNANYMRIYVPAGSKLLEVKGQTREFVEAPLDYEALGFKKDKDVQREEESIVVDYKTGTRIYEEAGKTVFANWTYVSPKEEMKISYKYALPFEVFSEDGKKISGSYSLLAQKQAGSQGSTFSSTITFPKKLKIVWSTPDDLKNTENEIKINDVLKTDKFWGVVFTRQ